MNEWVRKYEVYNDGVTTAENERATALEREVKELRQANEMLRLASTFFRPGGARPPQKEMTCVMRLAADYLLPSKGPGVAMVESESSGNDSDYSARVMKSHWLSKYLTIRMKNLNQLHLFR